MPQMWIWDETGIWSVLPLTSTCLDVWPSPPAAVPDAAQGSIDGDEVLLLSTVPRAEPYGTVYAGANAQPEAIWTLLWPRGVRVRVNGLPVATGFRVLRHQDEVRIGSRAPMYFSSERLARVEKLTRTDQKLQCPRDKSPIHVGDAMVICPGCGVAYHQTDELKCWTYAPKCALCPQTTDLDAGYSWVPEDLA